MHHFLVIETHGITCSNSQSKRLNVSIGNKAEFHAANFLLQDKHKKISLPLPRNSYKFVDAFSTCSFCKILIKPTYEKFDFSGVETSPFPGINFAETGIPYMFYILARKKQAETIENSYNLDLTTFKFYYASAKTIFADAKQIFADAKRKFASAIKIFADARINHASASINHASASINHASASINHASASINHASASIDFADAKIFHADAKSVLINAIS